MKIDQGLMGNKWRFLVVKGDASTNEFEVLDYTDNKETAESYLEQCPQVNIYALVAIEAVLTRRFAD